MPNKELRMSSSNIYITAIKDFLWWSKIRYVFKRIYVGSKVTRFNGCRKY